MKIKEWFLLIVEVASWFAFLYYFLYSIKNPVDLIQSALVLLALMYIALIACPWIRNSCGWKSMWQKEKKNIEK